MTSLRNDGEVEPLADGVGEILEKRSLRATIAFAEGVDLVEADETIRALVGESVAVEAARAARGFISSNSAVRLPLISLPAVNGLLKPRAITGMSAMLPSDKRTRSLRVRLAHSKMSWNRCFWMARRLASSNAGGTADCFGHWRNRSFT